MRGMLANGQGRGPLPPANKLRRKKDHDHAIPEKDPRRYDGRARCCCGAIINTFLPEVTNIGSFTTAVFTSAGANTAIGIQLFCLGTTLRVRDMGGVVKRGGVLLISKFVIGAAIGIVRGQGVRPHRPAGPELSGHHLRRRPTPTAPSTWP